VLLSEVVSTSQAVAATAGRSAKRDLLADLLRRLAPGEVEATVGLLVGELRQGRIGVGWATLADASDLDADPAGEPSIEVSELDSMLDLLAETQGPGSAGRRRDLLVDLFSRATVDETAFLHRLLTGELRQGALAGVMSDAVARAADVPAAAVRRATMLGGRLDATALLALTGGRAALDAVGLVPGRPLQPMLAATAPDPATAGDGFARTWVDWKLDGMRIQVHRVAGQVRVYTRNLNDVTERMAAVVDRVRALPGGDLVLDGEALVIGADDRPALFQDTVSTDNESGLRPYFFDLLHLDGRDLLEEPLSTRRAALESLVGPSAVPGQQIGGGPGGATSEVTVASVLDDALAAGHEGIMVKDLDSPYQAGRRGKGWLKVKPVHTLDLVVLAAEWGHGRRSGWLSNLHLGARDTTAAEGDEDQRWVMVGKTFKGMTDAMLAAQTARFSKITVREERWNDQSQTGVAWLRPEVVVEVAVDGIQRSSRYPGGVALRFARVVRYREDLSVDDVDSIDDVRALGTSSL